MRSFTIFKAAVLSVILFFLFNMVSLAQCTLVEDFESNFTNPGYAGKITALPSGEWLILGYGAMDANDRFLGTKSIRLRANNSDPNSGALTIPGDNTTGANVVQMQFDKPNGIGEVSFYYGSYSTHSGGKLFVEYSTDGGISWNQPDNNSVLSPAWNAVNEMQKFTVTVNVLGNARIRIIKYKQTGTSNSVNVDNICVTDFSCDNCVSAPKFTPNGGTYINPVNVAISSTTSGATIRYTLDGSEPVVSSTLYTSPILIAEQTSIKAKAWKEGMIESSVSTANYNFSQGIATLAQLRALAPPYPEGTTPNVGTTVYTYSGEAVITQTQNFNNIKYIQDQHGAMMIFDPSGNLKPDDLDIGDKVTNITGTLTNYFGLIEFVPIEGSCERVGYFQNVSAVLINASQLDRDYNNPIQSKVIRLENVQYVQSGNFGKGIYYNLKQNNVVYDSIVYTDNYDADYITSPIPTLLVNFNGVCLFKSTATIKGKNRIVPLDNSNPVVSISEINPSVIKLSPNPANSFVDIVTGSQMKLEVYTILGNVIHQESLYEGKNTVSVSNFPAGLYIMKLIDKNTGQTFMQKLVVN